jgi:hypothetical protein
VVGSAGVAGLRIDLDAGLEIHGRVQDARGVGAPGVPVTAQGLEVSEKEGSYGSVTTHADGSFRIVGLGPGRHVLAAGDELRGYAIQAGVAPGESDPVLTLRPGARVRLSLETADGGAPIAKASAVVESVSGVPVGFFEGIASVADSGGGLELAAPAGSLEIEVFAESRRGHASLTVGEGESATVAVVLSPQ